MILKSRVVPSLVRVQGKEAYIYKARIATKEAVYSVGEENFKDLLEYLDSLAKTRPKKRRGATAS